MATVTVRKFALSPDPDEPLDFTEPIDFFSGHFEALGFEVSGTYTFRYSDSECMIKAELQRSKDGFFVWLYVQAMDEHAWRVQELTEAFNAHLVDSTRKR